MLNGVYNLLGYWPKPLLAGLGVGTIFGVDLGLKLLRLEYWEFKFLREIWGGNEGACESYMALLPKLV